MARREVVDCDGCVSKAVADAQRVSLVVGQRVDPSGNGDTDDEVYVDLCPRCCARRLQAFLAKLDVRQASEWVDAWTTGKVRT